MRLHGGDIFVESVVNEYTRFTFRLPVNEAIPLNENRKNEKYVDTTANNETEE